MSTLYKIAAVVALVTMLTGLGLILTGQKAYGNSLANTGVLILILVFTIGTHEQVKHIRGQVAMAIMEIHGGAKGKTSNEIKEELKRGGWEA